MRNLTFKAVVQFLWEDIICRHGCFGKLVVDDGSENKDAVQELALRYGIKRVVVSAYHPQANRMIERGHKPIVDALAKLSEKAQRTEYNFFHPRQELLLGDFAAKIDHEEIPDLNHLLSQPESETDDDLSDAPSGLDYILGSDSETLSDVPDDFF